MTRATKEGTAILEISSEVCTHAIQKNTLQSYNLKALKPQEP